MGIFIRIGLLNYQRKDDSNKFMYKIFDYCQHTILVNTYSHKQKSLVLCKDSKSSLHFKGIMEDKFYLAHKHNVASKILYKIFMVISQNTPTNTLTHSFLW